MKSSEIQELEFFRPLSSIAYIETENQGTIDDHLSNLSEQLISRDVFNHHAQLPNLDPVIIRDANTLDNIKAEVIAACRASSAYNSIEVMPIPPTIDAILESKGKRFGLIIYYSGYKRSAESYAWSRRRAAVHNFLTSLSPVSFNGLITLDNAYSCRTVLYAIIVDAQTNKIVFFNESITKGEDPVSAELISRELGKIFQNYFSH